MNFSFKELSGFEKLLWITSLAAVTASFLTSKNFNLLSLFASLIGVSGVILCAKGNVWGQILIIIFSILYAVVSFEQKYYGEMITYLGMSAPVAAVSVYIWIKNPHTKSQVKVGKLDIKRLIILTVSTVIVTFIFYFILKHLGTNSLVFSTISVTTSFLASALTTLRVEYYALAYAANDIVLIILWIIAAIGDIGYLTMIICFSVFLINDVYGFYNWKKIKKIQENGR